MRTKLRIKTTLLFLAFAVAIFAVGGTAMAITTDTSGTTSSSPTIQSDKADYAPGELVTLRGSNWQPGESVRIVVDDDGLQEQTWRRDVVVTADEFGNVRDEFTLPSWFVATYQVTATGELSGTVTTTFTDNLDATGGGVNGGSSVTIGPQFGQDAPAHLTVTQTASSPQREWRSALVTVTGQNRSDSVCLNYIFHTLAPGGTATEYFNVSPPRFPTAAGTYDVVLKAASGDDCEGFTDTVTLKNAITVDPNVIFSEYFGSVAHPETGWTETETVRVTDCRVAGPSSNNFYAELRSNCSITNTINTSGRQNLSLQYLWGKGGQSGQLNVDWRVGTSGPFLPLASHDFNTDGVSGTGVPNSNTVNLPTTANNTSIQLRFTGTGDNEARVDAIRVSGTEMPPNTPPTAEANGPYSVNEGGSVTLSSASSTDPGGSIASYAWDLDNDGAFDDSTDQNPTFSAAGLDGPSSRTVRLQVTDNNGATGTDTATVNVLNVAPSVTAPANQSSDEGFPHAFNLGSFTDPGDDGPWTGTVDWGDGSPSESLDPFNSSPDSLGSRFHVYADNGTYTVTVTVTEAGDGAPSGSATLTATVLNVPPTVNLAGPNAADEGQTKTYNYTVADPGLDTFAAASGYPKCGAGGNLVSGSHTPTPSGGSGSFQCTFPDGDASPTVAMKVEDDAGDASTEATQPVNVSNVAPTASNGTLDLNPVLGTATAGFDFSDVGYLDTHLNSYFTWAGVGDTGNRPATVTGVEHDAPDATGHASDTRTLNPGCYNLTVTGTAKDDDNDTSAPLSIYSNSQQTSVYAKGFRPPIVDNERNIAKYGNVVPIKVQLTNPCTGTTVTNAALYITVHKGLNGEFIEDNNPVAESVSAADNGQQMRVADGGYIYNLSTKNLSANSDWAVRVRLGSTTGPVLLQAVLYPKK